MRREERALVNHHTKKDEEDSVNCVDVSQCTTGNDIGDKDDGNDDNNNGEMTVYPGEMIQTRLIAYLVSDVSHFPAGEVTTWNWQKHCKDPLIEKPSASFNTLSRKTKQGGKRK